ncbi:AraC family transcriptional regulator [Rhizorhabdus argentea]|uniref:AraC family transcriptional regulator n=1 Tax=Rhizorhabdus argentea TaxID=1387174 RepID=UPI0030ED57FA
MIEQMPFRSEEGLRTPHELDRFFARNLFAMDIDFLDVAGEVDMGCRVVQAGSILVSNFRTSGGATIRTERTWRRIREDSAQLYMLCFPLEGAVSLTQHGRCKLCLPNQFVVYRSSDPARADALKSECGVHNSLFVTIPAHEMQGLFANVDDMIAMPVPVSAGIASFARDVFLRLLSERHQFSSRSAEEFVMAGIGATIDAMEPSAEKVELNSLSGRSGANDILAYIERHLSDLDLSLAKVAQACGMHPRRVQALLNDRGIMFRDYVWNLRLARAHAKLGDSRFADQNIATIAYSEGFKSNAHFTRSFKKRYHATPSVVRLAQVAGEATAEA